MQMTELENSDAKRHKAAESNGKNSDAKPPEPLKDYIHVRARRGQATDAHSLAERVRRTTHPLFHVHFLLQNPLFLMQRLPSSSRLGEKRSARG